MQGHWLPWFPVAMALGIGSWFAWPSEPGPNLYALTAALALLALWRALRGDARLRQAQWAAVAVAAGFLACGVRVHSVAGPMLDFRYYGPVEGRLVGIDRSQSDALRLTFDRVILFDVAPDRTPRRVRISLQSGEAPLDVTLVPGQRLALTAHLSAPNGPVEPGSFDFRRKAFFDGLGAVGYSRNPVLLVSAPEGGDRMIDRVRMALSETITSAAPGDAGAFAAGVLTGDRSGLSIDAVRDLRDSSLAHLLAISGMNLAFLVSFVFVALRTLLAAIPPIALRVNAKKIAAVASIAIAYGYLLLSGANVATERAFLMVLVMLGAVLLDRRGITFRAAGVAATLIFLWSPESLLDPGFQMSFAATLALIAGFQAVDRAVLRERLPRWAIPVFTLVLSSVIGGVATAPFAAAHFNRYAEYGLIANLLTVPVMGAIVMPAGLVALLLAPLGLAAPAFWVMEAGSAFILGVARWIADLNGAVTMIPAPPAFVLGLIGFGGAVLILWRGAGRMAGVLPLAAALAVWVGAERPTLLIAGDGAVLGLLGPDGRALSVGRGGGFSAATWLENDGDAADQAMAALRPGFDGPAEARQVTLAGLRIVSLRGKKGAARLAEACAGADLVILNQPAPERPAGCRLLDPRDLRATGAIALWDGADGLRLVATEGARRRWSPPVRGDVSGGLAALLVPGRAVPAATATTERAVPVRVTPVVSGD